jgi:class 3 adenylate cyclase
MTLLGLEISLKDAVPLYAIDRSSMLLLKNAVFLFMGLALTGMTYYFIVNVWKAEAKAAFEFERAESLLRNILPSSIAERLKDSPTTIADGFDRATVLFTDIVDFTKLAEKLSPAEVVAVLNDLFSRFDIVAEKHGLEKIKTIGDAYMVASGIPERCEDDAHSIAEFALDIQEEVRAFNAERCLSVEIRVGINSGPVVAGVIGRKKFIYDLWGDAVNMASRMESHGLPGRIQVAEGTRRLLADDFELESRGVIEVKGKGQIPAWLLNGRKAKAVR